MKILSIETSCDETAVSIVEAEGGLENPNFSVLGNSLFSQIDIHKEYGGVFPMLAKREHTKNLPPLLMQTLVEASKKIVQENEEKREEKNCPTYSDETWQKIEEILAKERDFFPEFKKTFLNVGRPPIDCIAVTSGPGLEPALWVGISFATALGELWGLPVVPVNHMEGHITSVLLHAPEVYERDHVKLGKNTTKVWDANVAFPALAVLISGGHTEIVHIERWGAYHILGQTVDDAVGEAFDKVARLLGLPYPGGPEISKLAEKARTESLPHTAVFPRPMIHAKNLNFSFSGLKTAVLYYIRDLTATTHTELTETDKMDIAREFEDAVVDVLMHKTQEALLETGAQTLIVGGGVIANKKIKEAFGSLVETNPGLIVRTPTRELATDNSLMIASACYVNVCINPTLLSRPLGEQKKIIAQGNLKLGA